jgi:protein TonB
VQEVAGPTIRSTPLQHGAALADTTVPTVASASSQAVAPASALVAAAAQSVPAADLLAAYRQRLTQLLAGQHEYPRIAALRGWEGEVRLRLRVARKGNLLGVVLDHSSGFDVLDQHALAMLAALGGLPPVPEGLDGNEIQVVVPVSYKLNKTT